MWFCGLSSVTSNSRMLFAFARDDGTPGARFLKRVSPRWKTPHVAVWTSVAAAFVIALWAEAYSAMVAMATIANCASYAVPIGVGLKARLDGRWSERGPWDLGRRSHVVNVIALVWVSFIMVVFVLPPNELSGETFGGCLVVLAIYWFAYMRTRFRGPKFHH
jgi:amino acid transporter